MEYLYSIAVKVLAGVILAIGVGMIAVGNRSRKTALLVGQMDERCRSHGLPYSDVTQRVTSLETWRGEMDKARDEAIAEMRRANAALLNRIDALDNKMHKHVDRLEEKLLKEIRHVNGKVEAR